MGYLSQIIGRSQASSSAGLMKPSHVHPFASGANTDEGMLEETAPLYPRSEAPIMPVRAPEQKFQRVEPPLVASARDDLRPEEVVVPAPKYLMTQVKREQFTRIIQRQEKETRINWEERELLKERVETEKIGPSEPVAGKMAMDQRKDKESPAIPLPVIPMLAPPVLMPVRRIVPMTPDGGRANKSAVTSNNLVIGKITVEIVRPEPARQQERVITRIVQGGARPSPGVGRNKMSFGLGQL